MKDGEEVAAGTQITEGSADPKELLEIVNREAVQLYLVSEVQKVYKDQGVDIHDKHIEIIVRQMLKRVTVSDPGDSEFLPGQLVDYMEFEEEANRVVDEGGEPPRFKEVLLGITKASLATESFLSAASFQETTRVLTDAALSGQGGQAAGPQGERHHRQAHPDRLRHEAVPPHQRQADGRGVGAALHRRAAARAAAAARRDGHLQDGRHTFRRPGPR